MTWRKTLLFGLVFGISGLAYAAWAGKRERGAEARRRLAEMDDDGCENWCTCTDNHECEGHRS